ncbi:hypothetical protein Tco_0818282 [Tanacetum coccineum]
MAGVDINTLTMEQYLALSRDNQAPGVVKPEIGGNVNFKIKSQFMRELREDTFSGNKVEDAHDHIDRVLSIVGLFNIPGVSKDAVMLRVFPFTLTRAAKRYSQLQARRRRIIISGLGTGPIPRMRPAEALTAIQTMADNSQKWHDGTSSRKMGSSNSSDGLAALVNKLDNLGRDMKKLKESVYAIHVGRQICKGPHLDKDCPLNEEVKQVSEKLQENAEINTRHQNASLKNLEAQIKQLTKEICSNKALEQLKTITANHETSGLDRLHGVSFISDPESKTAEVLQHQLPHKELNPGNFTLPCMIGKFNLYAMADLDMSKKAPLRIVENVLVKIGKFLFLSDFVIIDNTPSEITIPGRPFLATIHAEIDSNNHVDYEESGNWDNRSPNLVPHPKHPLRNQTTLDLEIIPLGNGLCLRSFDDYKWEFNLEIDKLVDEYELGVGKKGHILDHIWEYCNQVHSKNYESHNYEFENEECEEIGIEDKDYHPPEVQVETFEVKKYSFNGRQSFTCVTKDLDNTLPLGSKNGSKFKEMIRNEIVNNKT